jgi:hypothetical protein
VPSSPGISSRIEQEGCDEPPGVPGGDAHARLVTAVADVGYQAAVPANVRATM